MSRPLENYETAVLLDKKRRIINWIKSVDPMKSWTSFDAQMNEIDLAKADLRKINEELSVRGQLI